MRLKRRKQLGGVGGGGEQSSSWVLICQGTGDWLAVNDSELDNGILFHSANFQERIFSDSTLSLMKSQCLEIVFMKLSFPII